LIVELLVGDEQDVEVAEKLLRHPQLPVLVEEVTLRVNCLISSLLDVGCAWGRGRDDNGSFDTLVLEQIELEIAHSDFLLFPMLWAVMLWRRPLRAIACFTRLVPVQVVQRAPYSFNVVAQQSDSAVAVRAQNAAYADPPAGVRDRVQSPVVHRSTSRARRESFGATRTRCR
jgi:hypothetical protein